MTEAECDDLIDLYVDGELPDALCGFMATYLSAHPDAAVEAAALKETAHRLQSVTPESPDDWFVERTLDRLLRQHGAAQETDTYIHTR